MFGVVLNAEGKGLLLQVVPHHLEVEAPADLHEAQVVAGLPARYQQSPQFGTAKGSAGVGGGTRGISQGHRWGAHGSIQPAWYQEPAYCQAKH